MAIGVQLPDPDESVPLWAVRCSGDPSLKPFLLGFNLIFK
jgi:hypothetical protein